MAKRKSPVLWRELDDPHFQELVKHRVGKGADSYLIDVPRESQLEAEFVTRWKQLRGDSPDSGSGVDVCLPKYRYRLDFAWRTDMVVLV